MGLRPGNGNREISRPEFMSAAITAAEVCQRYTNTYEKKKNTHSWMSESGRQGKLKQTEVMMPHAVIKSITAPVITSKHSFG